MAFTKILAHWDWSPKILYNALLCLKQLGNTKNDFATFYHCRHPTERHKGPKGDKSGRRGPKNLGSPVTMRQALVTCFYRSHWVIFALFCANFWLNHKLLLFSTSFSNHYFFHVTYEKLSLEWNNNLSVIAIYLQVASRGCFALAGLPRLQGAVFQSTLPRKIKIGLT